MATMNISLPDQMKDFVENQVSDGGYSTVSEYFRELVRKDQKQKAQEKIEALLLEGLESGKPLAVSPEHVKARRDELIQRYGKKIR